LEITRSAASIEPLTDFLACLEPKLWPKNPILPPNQKIAENAFESPIGGLRDSDNSPLEHDSELFEPSKDSWSLVVCTVKKSLKFGFFGGCRQKEGRFCFFFILLWRHHPNNEPKLWLKVWYFRQEYEALEPYIDFLTFLVPKLGPEDPNSPGNMPSDFRGFP